MTAAAPSTVRAVLLALAALLGARLVALAVVDAATLATRLPDDQFYYLSLAREFAATGRWTFDGGISPASGFHLLVAYLLVGLYLLIGQDIAVAVVATLLSAAASFAAALVAVPFLMRRFGLGAGVAALVLVPVAWWQNAAWVIEWPVVVLVSALAIRRLDAASAAPRWSDAAALALLGALGSLARADFGGLAFAFFAAAAIVCLVGGDRRPVAMAAALLAGAAAGLALVLLHHWLMTGAAIPGSARIKSQWIEVVGYRPVDFARFLFRQHLQPFIAAGGAAAAAIVVLVLAAGAAAGAWRRRASLAGLDAATATLLAGAALALALYIPFYGANAAVQPWYTANVAVAVLLLASWATAMAIEGIGDLARRAVVIAALAYSGLATAWAIDQGWMHQRHWLAMAQEIRRLPPEARVGAWNAGLLRFIADRPIVNLDGVVNDALHRYARERRLLDYLRAAGIEYVADFALMVDDPTMRRRGGYDDPAFRAALEPVLTVPGSAGEWGEGPLTLWRVRD